MSAPDPPSRFFEAIARRSDRVYAPDAATTRARMERVLTELAPRSRVLDLGVGTGRELGALQEAGHAPVGVDLSPAMLAICARRARPVPLVVADLWAPLPFDDGSFDAAIALHGTLAHPTRAGAEKALALEVARLLRPGGVFVAEVPGPALLTYLDARGAIEVGDLRMRRASADPIVTHEDRAAGVTVEAHVHDAAFWRALFPARFDVRVEPLGDLELLVVARAPTHAEGSVRP